MSAPHDFHKDDDLDDLAEETQVEEYNVSKKVVEYSFAAIFLIIGLVGVSHGVEYAGWAIFLAIVVGW